MFPPQIFSNHTDLINFINNSSNHPEAATSLFQHALYKIYKNASFESQKEGSTQPISQASQLLNYLEHPFLECWIKKPKGKEYVSKSLITYEKKDAALPKLGNNELQ
jgi:hypothetical protein